MWGHQCRHRVNRVKRSVLAFQSVPPISAERPQRALSEADAIDIWIARWLRIRRKDLVQRYGCDPRRLYEIWWGERFPASREKAMQLFAERHPGLADRTHFGYRRIPQAVESRGQLELFG
jgi:hypothetical protein